MQNPFQPPIFFWRILSLSVGLACKDFYRIMHMSSQSFRLLCILIKLPFFLGTFKRLPWSCTIVAIPPSFNTVLADREASNYPFASMLPKLTKFPIMVKLVHQWQSDASFGKTSSQKHEIGHFRLLNINQNFKKLNFGKKALNRHHFCPET